MGYRFVQITIVPMVAMFISGCANQNSHYTPPGKPFRKYNTHYMRSKDPNAACIIEKDNYPMELPFSGRVSIPMLAISEQFSGIIQMTNQTDAVLEDFIIAGGRFVINLPQQSKNTNDATCKLNSVFTFHISAKLFSQFGFGFLNDDVTVNIRFKSYGNIAAGKSIEGSLGIEMKSTVLDQYQDKISITFSGIPNKIHTR